MKDWEISESYLLPRIFCLNSRSNTLPNKLYKPNLRCLSLSDENEQWSAWRRSDYFYQEMIPEPDYSDSGDETADEEEKSSSSTSSYNHSPDPLTSIERLRDLTEFYVSDIDGKKTKSHLHIISNNEGESLTKSNTQKPSKTLPKSSSGKFKEVIKKKQVSSTRCKPSSSDNSSYRNKHFNLPAEYIPKTPIELSLEKYDESTYKANSRATSRSKQRPILMSVLSTEQKSKDFAAKSQPVMNKISVIAASSKTKPLQKKENPIPISKEKIAQSEEAPVDVIKLFAAKSEKDKRKQVASKNKANSGKAFEEKRASPEKDTFSKNGSASDEENKLQQVEQLPVGYSYKTADVSDKFKFSASIIAPNQPLSDRDQLIKPKKPVPPHLFSAERQKLHKELKFSQKYGLSGINHKTELELALQRYAENKEKREMVEEEKTSLEKILELQAKKIELEENMEKSCSCSGHLQKPSATLTDPKTNEFYRVHARVVCNSLKVCCFSQ